MSGIVLENFLLRLVQAARSGALEKEERHFFTETLALDRASWEALVSHLDSVLAWMVRLEQESAARLALTGEMPLSLTIALLAFRSQSAELDQEAPCEPMRKRASPPGPHFIMNPRTAKALSDPWRGRILAELYRRPMSPRQFGEQFGGPDIATTGRYFRQLKNWGFLEVVEVLRGGQRRGAVEKVYRGIRRLPFNTTPWRDLPAGIRGRDPGNILDGLVSRINEALITGSLDADVDRHTSWLLLWLDRQALKECLLRLRETQNWVSELCTQAADHLAASRDGAIPTTVALLGFHSP